MAKARSRLKKQPWLRFHGAPRTGLLKRYWLHLSALLMCLPFYGAVYYHLHFIHPEKIRHFLIPNSYLPLQAYLFIGNFFFFSFILLHSRRGLVMSCLLMTLLFFKLQTVLSWPLALVTVAIFTAFEIVSSLLDR